MRLRNPDRQRGFTLLELVVAIAIFAIASWLSYGGLRQVLAGREVLLPRMAADAARVRGLTLLSGDIEQVRPRAVRDALGTASPALVSGGPSAALLELTRGDPARALLADLPSVYRVSYALREGRLEREIWPVLDRVQSSKPQRQVLFSKVASVSFRFLASAPDAQWTGFWPPEANGPGLEQLPRGVEFELVFVDGNTLHRVLRPVVGQ